MTVPTRTPGDPQRADERMAELLSESSSSAEARRRLQTEGSPESEDLLGRLNALDFCNAVVGQATDVPERLGEYVISGLLGKGGMGTVYLAFQEQLEREVALKVLSPSYSTDPTMRQRFRAEAKATAALHHRHIVPIYDYGEAQGMLYFAMERVDGQSLDKHIAAMRRVGKKPLAPIDAARRFAGVADALGLAHRRRILHRDVKPGNILVGEDGTMALTDFGLAKALDQGAARLTTKGGGFLGTLHYSSPEQALGRELTPASDLYSLGVTIFEAVSGELPLSGNNTESLLQAILYGKPRRLREVLPKPPRDLEAVLDKLLAREPQDRYQDGEALARDLLRIADGEPVHVRRQPLLLRLWRRMKKQPVLSGAIVAAVVLLVLTLLLFRGLRQVTGQSLESRHQNRLVHVVNDVMMETGPAFGPDGLFTCLSGIAVPQPPIGEQVLEALAKAGAEMPEDETVGLMRAAYVNEPLPKALEQLRLGHGYEAMRLYEEAIQTAVSARTGTSLSVELRLYGLYLGSAVAKLTAAVGRLNDARRDLALASFLRPGASFPRSLECVLDVAQAPNRGQELKKLQQRSDFPAEQRLVVAQLLWALAGLRPVAGANLMDFGLDYADRRSIHEAGLAWSAVPPGGTLERGSSTGFEAQLAELGRQALAAAPPALLPIVQRGKSLLAESVHPESPVQSWRLVFQLLEQASGAGPRRSDLSLEQQLLGWQRLLSLEPSPERLLQLNPWFEPQWLTSEQPAVLRVTAWFESLLGVRPEDLARLDKVVRRYVAAAAGDPDALFCRLHVHLQAARVDAAVDDATAAVQVSVDRPAAIARVCRAFATAAAGATGAVRARLLALHDDFKATGA